MSVTKRVGLLAGAATLSLTGASIADVTAGEMQSEIDALKAQVAELRQNQKSDWLTPERADQVKGLVQDVLADADTRASLLQGGPMAGHDGHFFLASPDGNYRLNIGGLLQVGAVWNNQDDGGGSNDEDRWGVENKRTKLMFWGHVVNPDWMYKIETGFSRGTSNSSGLGGSSLYSDEFSDALDPDDFEDIEDYLDALASSLLSGSYNSSDCCFELLDAWIAHNCGNGLTVYVGQFKAPFLAEELVDAQNSLAYERSAVSDFFTSARVQGIMLHYVADVWDVAGTFDDGIRSANTAWSNYDTEYSFHVRGNWYAAGTMDQMNQITSPRGQEFGLRLGAALRYSEQEYGTAGPLGGEATLFSWTIDGTVQFGGASIMAAIIGNHLDFDGLATDLDQYGIVIQGGFYLTDEWEIFARYEWADSDITGVEDLSLLTFGVNYYFAGQQVKWTADIVFGLNEIDSYFTSRFARGDINGLRSDAAGEDGQIAIRTGLQLVF